MSTTEAILEKLSVLPAEKQERVLEFLESLATPPKPVLGNTKPHAWLDIAMSMKLEGPPDLSEHLDDYLYREKTNAW